jgi:hypothetical protein
MLSIKKDPFHKGLYTFFRGCFGQYRKICNTFIAPFVVTTTTTGRGGGRRHDTTTGSTADPNVPDFQWIIGIRAELFSLSLCCTNYCYYVILLPGVVMRLEALLVGSSCNIV